MANLQQYTKATVYINGLKLTQEASVSITRNSNSQAVNTVDLGYSGESPGAATTEIQVSNAVPSVDFELNPGKFINDVEIVEVSIFAANSTLTVKGFIISDNFSHAVNSSPKLDFTFRGGPSNWE